jgi:hypothetical protein
VFYQFRADRARRALRGIDEQIAKAESAVAGKTPVKRNRFVTLTGGDKTVNRDLEAKARALAGLKGYTTNLPDPNAEFVIGAYHQLWHIEKSSGCPSMTCVPGRSTTTNASRLPLTWAIVFAALAVTHHIETSTGWSIKKFIRTARRYRTVQVRAGSQILTAEDPPPTTYETPSPRSVDREVRTKLIRVRSSGDAGRSLGVARSQRSSPSSSIGPPWRCSSRHFGALHRGRAAGPAGGQHGLRPASLGGRSCASI